MDPALPVKLVPYDSSVEETGDVSNMTAEQYISWVKQQSDKLPNVMKTDKVIVSSNQVTQIPENTNIKSCLKEYLPSREWELGVIHRFAELRLNIYNKSLVAEHKERKIQVPTMKDRFGWLIFCFGDDIIDILKEELQRTNNSRTNTTNILVSSEDKLDLDAIKKNLVESLGIDTVLDDEEKCVYNQEIFLQDAVQKDDEDEEELNDDVSIEDEGTICWSGPKDLEPTLSLLLQFDNVLSQKLLRYLIEWAEEHSWSLKLSRWLYSLLARIEKPLHREVVALIRQLFRKCCALRYELAPRTENFSQNNNFDDEYLASLNLIITLTGIYFGQGESFIDYNIEDIEKTIISKNSLTNDGNRNNEKQNLLTDESWDFDDDIEGDDDEEEYYDEFSTSVPESTNTQLNIQDFPDDKEEEEN